MKSLLILLALAVSAHAESLGSPLQTAKPIVNGAAWGPGQAAGAPDAAAGDNQKAWATMGADEGLQWLELDYARSVPIEGLRIFENHNPGAVVKVEAMVDDGEPVVLWQGEAPKKPEPHVFTVDTQAKLSVRRVRITLDTNKIPGWNEIDAVELIGRDGTRQWATAARASSTYASVTGGDDGTTDAGDPLVDLQGKRVRVRVGGETLSGTLGPQAGDYIQLQTASKLLYLNAEQIAWISAE